ncbi:hypothetical protein PACTADRAFT_51891 [Pachysolen tannophilus NRRL Y-2460]|uniref:Rho-GAP domain-containing protein n=1 Tax=Pachysolen tannophilus NRRL Y-2460 TaxID=669874 RepID=A0A1E4TNM2_PACTA|nr:hypothetical protein PACTADRAFT_51891 [Pachysolen tannophilus NRRL Y-2460]
MESISSRLGKTSEVLETDQQYQQYQQGYLVQNDKSKEELIELNKNLLNEISSLKKDKESLYEIVIEKDKMIKTLKLKISEYDKKFQTESPASSSGASVKTPITTNFNFNNKGVNGSQSHLSPPVEVINNDSNINNNSGTDSVPPPRSLQRKISNNGPYRSNRLTPSSSGKDSNSLIGNSPDNSINSRIQSQENIVSSNDYSNTTITSQEITMPVSSVDANKTITLDETGNKNKNIKSDNDDALLPGLSPKDLIPIRNPNHRIVSPISVGNGNGTSNENGDIKSPTRSIRTVSSSYLTSPESAARNSITTASLGFARNNADLDLETPENSPTKMRYNPQLKNAPQPQVSIPLNGMILGSTPRRNLSPCRVGARMRGNSSPGAWMSRSPLKNESTNANIDDGYNAIKDRNVHTPLVLASDNNEEEDEFIFSPSNLNNKSKSSLTKTSTHSSFVFSDHENHNNNHTSNNNNNNDINKTEDIDMVVQYMNQKLNTNVSNGAESDNPYIVSHSSSSQTATTDNTRKPPVIGPPVIGRPALTNQNSNNVPNMTLNPPASSGNFDNRVSQSNTENEFNAETAKKAAGYSNNTTTRSTASSTAASTPNPNLKTDDLYTEDELKGLMVRPADLPTTLICVVSVIDTNAAKANKKSDDPSITFGCFFVEEKTGERREIFKFSKTYSQLLEFDSIIRPFFFQLVPLPEISAFHRTTPNTIEFRRQILMNYFFKIFELRIKPKGLSLSICRFVSSDVIFNFDVNETVMKEGCMLKKSIGKLNTGNNWKIVWCSVYGSTFTIDELHSNQLATSGKKSVLNVTECKLVNEEDGKDYKYAISIIEPKRSVLSSSSNKILLCAESNLDKTEWLEALAKAYSNNGNGDFSSSNTSLINDATTMHPQTSDISSDSSSLKHGKYLNSPEVPVTPTMRSHEVNGNGSNNNNEGKKKRVGLFSMKRQTNIFNLGNNSGGNNNNSVNDEKVQDDYLRPTTIIEPTTTVTRNANDTSYQASSTLTEDKTPSRNTESSYSYSPYSPTPSGSASRELFGSSLQESIELSSSVYKSKEIPSICFRCIDLLEREDAIYSEGLFRLTGKSSEIKFLNDSFNYKYDLDFYELEKLPDVHSVSTLLKRYLRSLKESVITPEFIDDLKKSDANSGDKFVELLKKDVHDLRLLPEVNYNLLYIIISYLTKVVDNKEYNKMDINNITMLFSVNFNCDEYILAELIINFNYIFDNTGSIVPEDKRPFIRNKK